MFFSKIKLRPPAGSDTRLLKSLSNPDREHRVLWKFFSNDPDRDRDFIYRRLLDARLPTFLTISERKPDNPDPQSWMLEVKPFEPDLRQGMILQFSLRANATVKKDGSRHDVVMNYKYELENEERVPREEWPPESEIEYEAGLEWIQKRDEKNGFRVQEESFRIQRHETQRFEKSDSDRMIHLGILDMAGMLKVNDEKKFMDTLREGIGRSKTYGCGMMMVKLP